MNERSLGTADSILLRERMQAGHQCKRHGRTSVGYIFDSIWIEAENTSENEHPENEVAERTKWF